MNKTDTTIFAVVVLVIISIFLLASYTTNNITGYVPYTGTISESPFKYYLKPSLKLPFEYDIMAQVEKLKEKIEVGKKAVIDCLKAGSWQSGDDDVEECAQPAGLVGVDGEGEYYLKFDIEETAPEGFSKKKVTYKIALLLEDNIPPPQVFLKKLPDLYIKKIKFGIESLASDTFAYEVYCNKDGGNWKSQENFFTEEEILIKEYNICGTTEGRYCFGVIALDEVSNKIGDVPTIKFKLNRNMICEDIKNKCCKKDSTFEFGTIESCPSGYVEVGYDKCS